LILSAFYSAGLALPFLLTGLGINKFLGFYGKFRKHLHKVEVVSGVVLILVGILVMSGQSTLLASSKLTGKLPNAEELVVRFQTWWYGEKAVGPTTVASTYEPVPD